MKRLFGLLCVAYVCATYHLGELFARKKGSKP